MNLHLLQMPAPQLSLLCFCILLGSTVWTKATGLNAGDQGVLGNTGWMAAATVTLACPATLPTPSGSKLTATCTLELNVRASSPCFCSRSGNDSPR